MKLLGRWSLTQMDSPRFMLSSSLNGPRDGGNGLPGQKIRRYEDAM